MRLHQELKSLNWKKKMNFLFDLYLRIAGELDTSVIFTNKTPGGLRSLFKELPTAQKRISDGHSVCEIQCGKRCI